MIEYVNHEELDISFCLPVYNVYPYLGDCVKSILSQNLQFYNITYEIFCIDDASSDGSFEWLAECSKQVPQLRLEKNDVNKGVSYTRNRLAKEAKGKYIWYIDPDDMLIKNVVNTFYRLAKENHADIFLGNYIRVAEDAIESDERYLSDSIENINVQKTKKQLPCDSSGNGMNTVCAGLFLRSFLLNNNLVMNEKMIAQEDTLFYYQCFLKTQNVYKCNVPCYLYRQRATSIMHTHSDLRMRKYYLSMVEMLRVYQEHMSNNDYDDEKLLKHKIHHCKQNISTCLASTQDKKYIKEQLKILKQNKIYPYKFRKDAFDVKPWHLGFLTFMLPLRPFFWLYHYAYLFTHEK